MTVPILHLATVDSTNAEALRRATLGEVGPLWIIADEQEKGRGRSGRAWGSARGNLQASLLVTLARADRAYQLSLVAGTAAHAALVRLLPDIAPCLRLKWPNDLMISGPRGPMKTGGILVESLTAGSGLRAVIGLGINLVSHPEGLDRLATHLGALGTAPSPLELLEALSDAMAHWLEVWQEGDGFVAVREAWLMAAHPVGEQMNINTGAGPIAGTFAGLDPEGALLLADEHGRPSRFTFGDVTLTGGAPD